MGTTMTKTISISSNTLMSNQPCSVEMFQNEQKGIIFHNGNNSVKACVDNVISTQNCTVIGNQNIQVGLIEHFMAALAICKIEDLNVNIDNKEMPILDGSAKEWVELFRKSDLKQNIEKSFTLKQPVYYVKDKTTIVALPDEKFSVSYCIDFNNNDLNSRWVNFDGTNIEEITEARTFGYLKDLERFQAMGIALGVNENNTVGLLDDGYTTELRSNWEPAKHKILDLIGDFYLTGFNPLQLKARIIAQNAGHSSHVEMAKILRDFIIEEN